MPCLDLHIKVRNKVKVQLVQKISNLPPALNARPSRPMVDFVALLFGILIAKRLSNVKSMSSNLAFIPVANI